MGIAKSMGVTINILTFSFKSSARFTSNVVGMSLVYVPTKLSKWSTSRDILVDFFNEIFLLIFGENWKKIFIPRKHSANCFEIT